MEKDVITKEALLKAIALQDATNLKFGEMAGSMGLITSAQVDRVHEAQRSEDLQFGDMCVKLGILTVSSWKRVRQSKRPPHVFIGEALIKVGAVKADDLPKHLDAFKADGAPTRSTRWRSLQACSFPPSGKSLLTLRTRCCPGW